MKLSNKIKVLLLCLVMAVSSLALFACTTDAGEPTVVPGDPLNVKEYEDDYQPDYKTFNDVTVDGFVTEEEWAGQTKFTLSTEIGGILHDIEASSKYTDEGFAIYWKVLGAPAFYNAGRDNHNNSAVEMYVASGNAISANDNAYEIPMLPNGIYGASKYIKAGGANSYGYKMFSAEIFLAGQIDGVLNDPTNNGFIIETVIPWFLLGASKDNKPDYVCIDAAIINVTSEVGSRNAWYSLASNHRSNYGWTSPQGWYKFSANGYEDDSVYDGLFKVNKFTKGIEVTNNDKDITIDNSWNGGMIYADVVEAVTGDFYQEVKIFKPSLYDSSVAQYEEQPFADGKVDVGIGGLNIKTKDGSKDLQVAGHLDNSNSGGKWRVRFQGASWASVALSATQFAKFSDPDEGLRIGMLVIGTTMYGFVEDDNGVMQKFSEYDLLKRDPNYAVGSEKFVGVSSRAGCFFKDYQLYTGDDFDTIPTIINGGEPVVGGSVNVIGNVKHGAVVEATPNSGYDLVSLKINGVEVNSLFYDVPAMSIPKLNIEVKFAPSTVAKTAITFNVNAGYVGETATAFNGRINFSGENSGAGKVVDGSITVELADGEYTVVATDCYPTTITVTNGVASVTEINLIKSIFINSPYWTIGADENGYNATTSISDGNVTNGLEFGVIDFTDSHQYGAVIDFTFTGSLSSSSKYFPSFEIIAKDGTRNTVQLCCWSTNSIIKWYNAGTNHGNIVSGGGNFSVDLRIIISGTTFSIYKKSGSTYAEVTGVLDTGKEVATVKIGYCNDYTTETPEVWSFKNINVSALDGIDVTVADCAEADVTLNKETVGFGQKLVVNVVPKSTGNDSATVVTAIKINGQEVDFTVADGVAVATYIVKDLTLTDINVQVTTRNASYVDVNADIKTGYAFSASNLTAVQDGTEVTFTGINNYTATVTNGKVALSMAEGSYVVKVGDSLSATINLTTEGITEIILPVAIITEDRQAMGDTAPHNKTFEYGYSDTLGYYVSSGDQSGVIYQAIADVFDYSNGVKIEFYFTTNNVTGSSRFFPAIFVGGRDGNGTETRTEMQFCVWNGNLYLKQGALNNQQVSTGLSGNMSTKCVLSIVKNNGNVQLIMEINNKTITTDYANTSNTKTSDWKYLTTIEEIGFQYTDNGERGDATWSFNNIKILPLNA